MSCDLLPAETPGQHYEGDVLDILDYGWDLLIAHPVCTYHTNAAVRWFTTIPAKPKPGVVYGEDRWAEWDKAVEFFLKIRDANVPKIAIENPIMHGYSREVVGDPTQIIQPWQFGHKEMKATCLWLKGLPNLKPTNIVGPPPADPIERRTWAKVHRASPGPNRWKERSRTYRGIAEAMADQWGRL
jgi:hypothetical protein